jgi:transcriptional regulator with XRE-family HTH domain
MKDRLLKFLVEQNLSATQFADEVGVQRSGVSHILSGRNNPGFDFIQKTLSSYPHLSADWLIMGTGPMFKQDVPPHSDLFSSTFDADASVAPDASPTSYGTARDAAPSSVALPPPVVVSPENKSKQIDRIVIFYSDRTCAEYNPL